MLCHNAQGGGQPQEYGGRFPKRQLVSYFFFSPTGAPRKSSKCLPEVRWGGPGAAQRRQGQSRGACGARDGSGLVLMGPRHATGGHMCHGPGRPSGVNSARNCPAEPHMPAHGPTNEPLSTLLVPTDYPDPLKPAPLRRSPPPAPPSPSMYPCPYPARHRFRHHTAQRATCGSGQPLPEHPPGTHRLPWPSDACPPSPFAAASPSQLRMPMSTSEPRPPNPASHRPSSDHAKRPGACERPPGTH